MIKAIRNTLLLLTVLCIAAIAVLYLDFTSWRERALNLPESGLELEIIPGTTITGLDRKLVNDGISDRMVYLRILARLSDQTNRIKAGEYLVTAGTTPTGLLDQLEAGKVTLYSHTIIEGRNYREIVSELSQNPALSTTEANTPNVTPLHERAGVEYDNPEGWFLPDTYHFPKNTTDVDYLRRAHIAMQATLAQAWQERDPDLPLKSPYEVLILASIIEKETGRADERRKIAGVFVSRLRKGMLLQTDPTVIYGMGENYDGNIRKKDLRADTPWNTYVHRGLPPTPIAMPGRASILAAVHPDVDGSLYFVATGHEGRHYFSKTLKEHNRAVAKYQLKK